MSWEPPVLTTTLIVSAIGFWWLLFSSNTPAYQKFLSVAASVTFAAWYIGPRELCDQMYSSGYKFIIEYRPHVLLIHHINMVLTLSAVIWLIHRSWQTLWKPVPELINILGVDVPEPPDVSLAGISAKAATLNWTRPASHRPVQKYIIQVNGVHVGDAIASDTAITVTGLKPNHFYNIRVVAVGPNNFQAGSSVLRLRTFDQHGKPQLGNSRLPTNFADYDTSHATFPNVSDESPTAIQSIAAVDVANAQDGSSNIRELNSASMGQRRNTLNRRHSPSVASLDQPRYRSGNSGEPELTLNELNQRFESIRKETEDTLAQYAKEEAEFQQQEEELKKEKERKRQALKEKEEQTAQLKAMVRTTMEQVRVVEKEKLKKEQQLRDKESKKTKIRDGVAKLERDTERMRTERNGFESQKAKMEARRDAKVKELLGEIDSLQENCVTLEADLKEKGKQLQDLKETRQTLPGSDDQEWVEEDIRLRREWELKRQGLQSQLITENKRSRQLNSYLNYLREQINMQHQAGLAPFYNHPDSSTMDFDTSPPLQQPKRLSLGTSSVSPNTLASAEPHRAPGLGLGQLGFGNGLFMNVAHEDKSGESQTEAELRAQVGPLSPSAQSLLPSGIFDDPENLDSKTKSSPFLPEAVATEDEEPRSPASSGPSMRFFSSPHGSMSNLPFPQYSEPGERRSQTLQSSPAPPVPSSHRLHNLFSSLHRSLANRGSEETGPAFGSLKPNQSQSFPRGNDDHDASIARRRTSFTWGQRDSEGETEGTAHGMKAASSRRLNNLTNSASALFSGDRHDGSRPASIASAELPRPSTDSGSIWGMPGDPLGIVKSRVWSPSDQRWQSRNGSRRPSLHGSSANLTTTLASADDEILDEDDLLNPQTSPSQIGVIGSRPPGPSRFVNQRLNPAAPTFMGNLFRSKDVSDKGRVKDRKDKKEAKDKGKEVAAAPSIELNGNPDDSPSESRMSRDTFSVHTQPSVTESHESLPLDHVVSSTTSDMTSGGASLKDPENVVKKLFRKGSSGRFGLSTRLGKDSGLFKKSGGGLPSSDRNTSSEFRSSIGDVDDVGDDAAYLGQSYDSVTSSPSMGTSKSRDSKDSKTSWRFSIRKKDKATPSKEKESLELDRPTDEE